MASKRKRKKPAGVDFPCPRCGARVKRTLAWLRKRREACAEGRGPFGCPGACGIEFSSVNLLRTSPGYVPTDADATQFFGELIGDLEHEKRKRKGKRTKQ